MAGKKGGFSDKGSKPISPNNMAKNMEKNMKQTPKSKGQFDLSGARKSANVKAGRANPSGGKKGK